ncbi:MAG: Rrf2 family transcriptional regulator [Planctomycetes bacterium]|nr:Rrf2 family transcriptional regulator [Planctomycetota bacterium]
MLSLTRKTDYALLALTYLATRAAEVVSAREMAERFALSSGLLMNVLKQLSAAGLVDSVRGAHGGYRLAQAPERITLADLIDTMEGPVRLAPCVGGGEGDANGCGASRLCPIQGPLQLLHDRLRGFFGEITLAELAAAEPRDGADTVNAGAQQP